MNRYAIAVGVAAVATGIYLWFRRQPKRAEYQKKRPSSTPSHRQSAIRAGNNQLLAPKSPLAAQIEKRSSLKSTSTVSPTSNPETTNQAAFKLRSEAASTAVNNQITDLEPKLPQKPTFRDETDITITNVPKAGIDKVPDVDPVSIVSSSEPVAANPANVMEPIGDSVASVRFAVEEAKVGPKEETVDEVDPNDALDSAEPSAEATISTNTQSQKKKGKRGKKQ